MEARPPGSTLEEALEVFASGTLASEVDGLEDVGGKRHRHHAGGTQGQVSEGVTRHVHPHAFA